MASHFAFEAIGTHWEIDIYEMLSSQEESILLQRIHERIEQFENTYSRFRPDSTISTVSKVVGQHTMPEDAKELLATYAAFYTTTKGLFTPFMGQVLADAGYDSTYSLQQQNTLTAPPQWQDVMEYHHPVLHVKKPFLFDFGAAGKGYIIDIIATLIESKGVHAFCIDAGGDILQRNTSALRVGLEHPGDTTKVIGIVELHNKSICGSSGNRRKWQQFHHIINPHTLISPSEILAVWVIADTTILADALATCLFFVDQDILKDYQFEYLLVHQDYSIEKSAGFTAVLY